MTKPSERRRGSTRLLLDVQGLGRTESRRLSEVRLASFDSHRPRRQSSALVSDARRRRVVPGGGGGRRGPCLVRLLMRYRGGGGGALCRRVCATLTLNVGERRVRPSGAEASLLDFKVTRRSTAPPLGGSDDSLLAWRGREEVRRARQEINTRSFTKRRRHPPDVTPSVSVRGAQRQEPPAALSNRALWVTGRQRRRLHRPGVVRRWEGLLVGGPRPLTHWSSAPSASTRQTPSWCGGASWAGPAWAAWSWGWSAWRCRCWPPPPGCRGGWAR